MKRIEVNHGDRYGMLTVIKENNQRIEKSGKSKRMILCICDCGNEVNVILDNMRRGRTASCGCTHGEFHGLHGTRIYNTWKGMKQRCYNASDHNKKYYQNRGIKLCKEWQVSFKSFYNWSISNGYKDHLTIDRIDPYDDYKPSNCRWITHFENSGRANRGRKRSAPLQSV